MTRPPASRRRRAWWLGAASLALVTAGAAAAGAYGAVRRALWLPERRAIHSGRVSADTVALADLPLIEVPAAGAGGVLAVLITGDGGWVGPDRGIAGALAAQGVPVVGLSAPRYFSRARAPDEAGRDLARMVRHYAAAWGRGRVVVIGYSRGADVAPSMVARLPDDLRRRVALVALLGPSEWSGFEFHVADILWNIHRPGDLSVRAEIGRLRGTPVLCIYGRRDRHAICPSLDTALARPVARDGGHRVGYREGPALADTILRALATRDSALGTRPYTLTSDVSDLMSRVWARWRCRDAGAAPMEPAMAG